MANSSGASVSDLKLGFPVVAGFVIIFVFLGSFAAWAVLAHLDSAAIAEGIVIVDSKRKTVQHLEGGIIGEILVKEGDEVSAGDPLVILDETRPRANLEMSLGQYASERALEARLTAERDGEESIRFPEDLGAGLSEARVVELKSSQQSIFRARRKSLGGQTNILKQQIAQLRAESVGVREQIGSQTEQIALLEDEARSLENMYRKGLTGKSRLRQLQAEIVEIQGLRSKNHASVSSIQRNISEARLKISELQTGMLSEVVQELREVQAEIRALSDKILALEDVQKRTVIKAPITGMVMDLQVFTVGGVIAPGKDILDIVPKGERLIIEARVDPNDIDDVQAGMEAEVNFTSFSQRTTLPAFGNVMTVSADHFTDERTGMNYFLARVELTEESLDALKDKKVTPGMPVQVMIVTGARTPLDYLIRPFSDSFNRALRET